MPENDATSTLRASRRRRGSLASVMLLLSTLTACSGAGNHTLTMGVANGEFPIEVRTDQSNRFVTFVGGRAQHAPRFIDVAGTNFYLLRSWLDRQTGLAAHQLYVTDSYRGTLHSWNEARTGTEDSLRFVPISHDEITCKDGCSFIEEFGADLPDALLRERPDGFDVVFSGADGATKTIHLTSAQVLSELGAVDTERRTLGLPAPADTPAAVPAVPQSAPPDQGTARY